MIVYRNLKVLLNRQKDTPFDKGGEVTLTPTNIRYIDHLTGGLYNGLTELVFDNSEDLELVKNDLYTNLSGRLLVSPVNTAREILNGIDGVDTDTGGVVLIDTNLFADPGEILYNITQCLFKHEFKFPIVFLTQVRSSLHLFCNQRFKFYTEENRVVLIKNHIGRPWVQTHFKDNIESREVIYK